MTSTSRGARLTKYEHACFVVDDGDRALVVDPGIHTRALPDLANIAGVVITHEHADHWSPEHLARIAGTNPGVRFFGPPGVAAAVGDVDVTAVHAGERVHAGPFEIEFFGGLHAEIHRTVPRVDNLGILVDEAVFYPGDSLTPGPEGVDVLAVPASGPWLRIGDAMDYVATMKPKRAFTTHEMISSPIGNGIADQRIGDAVRAAGGRFLPLGPGESIELTVPLRERNRDV